MGLPVTIINGEKAPIVLTQVPGVGPAGGSAVVISTDAAMTDITTLLDAAVAAGAAHILIPYRATAYPMASKWTATGIHLEFAQGAVVSCSMTTPAMDLTACRLTNATITSAHTAALDATASATHPYNARGIVLRDDCSVEGHTASYVSSGLDIQGDRVRVRRATFNNVRQYEGWGAAVHVMGDHAHVMDLTITSCDRAIEVEAGASYNTFEVGAITSVGPNGYTGQPGNYATYTFVLDSHSHSGEGACRGNVFRDFRLVDCRGGITAVRSSGTNDSDLPVGCRWERITIEGRVGTTGYESVYVQGHDHHVDVSLRLGSGVTTMARCYIADGNNSAITITEASGYALPLVAGMSTADGARITAARISAPSAGTGYLFDIDTPRTLLDLDVRAVTGTTGYLNLDDSAHGSRIDRFRYTVDAAETFAAVIRLGGTQDVDLDGIFGTNNVAAVPDIITAGSVLRGRARGTISRNAVAVSVNLGGAASLFDTTKLDTTLGTITDSAVNSRIARDGYGSDLICSLGDNPIWAAAVAASSTATPITWPVANEGIWVRRRVGRRSSLTRFRFKVVTQSGNYYAAVTNSAGVVLWKTLTTLPAAGVVSLTMTGVNVAPGEMLTMVLALSSATAAVCGVTAAGADQNVFATVNGPPASGKVSGLYTTNTAVGGTIALGSTHPNFVPLITLIEA